MRGGTKFLASSAVLILTACGGESGKLEIRSTPTALAPGKKPVSFRVAEGHQQMAMNNVALALESYRRALYEDPNSVDAHAGIAAAYDRMGRYDLSRRSYEAALAIEPGNTTVLAMLAASLDQQGKPAAAMAVRNEIKQRMAAEAPAAPTAVVADVELVLPKPDLTAALPALASSPISVSLGSIAPVAVAAAFAPDEPATVKVAQALPTVTAPNPDAQAEITAPAKSVTVKLPPAAPRQVAAFAPPASAPAAPQPAPLPKASPAIVEALAKARRAEAAIPVATGRGPRLERTSLGEVALITTNAPQWASLVVKQDQRSTTVRFVPLKEARAKFASVKLLNAARVQGLAAKARSTLIDRGWRSLAIGDADAIRARSLVLYPAHRRATGLSLARQFGFEAIEKATGKEITVLLGRDAAVLARRSPAG